MAGWLDAESTSNNNVQLEGMARSQAHCMTVRTAALMHSRGRVVSEHWVYYGQTFDTYLLWVTSAQQVV